VNAAPTIVMRSTLTCPLCGAVRTEAMPTDACQYYYQCTACLALLTPRPGDCCVFCSYGDVACPPRQFAGNSDCGGACDARRGADDGVTR
jgi:hypothetical protein